MHEHLKQYLFICKYITNRPYINASGANSKLNFVFLFPIFTLLSHYIHIFVIGTLDYPDYLLKSQLSG